MAVERAGLAVRSDELLDVAHVREGLHQSQLISEPRNTLDFLGAGLEQPDVPLRTSAARHWRGPQRACGGSDELLDVAHVRVGLHLSQPRSEARGVGAGLEQPDGPVRTSAVHHSPSRPSPYCNAKPRLARRTFPRRRHNAQEPKQKHSARRLRPHLWRLESHYDFHGLKTVQVLDLSHTAIFDEDLEELVSLGSVIRYTLNLSGCMCSLNAEPLSRIHHIHTLNLSYGTMLSRVEGLNEHLTLAAMSGRRKPSDFFSSLAFSLGYCSSTRYM